MKIIIKNMKLNFLNIGLKNQTYIAIITKYFILFTTILKTELFYKFHTKFVCTHFLMQVF